MKKNLSFVMLKPGYLEHYEEVCHRINAVGGKIVEARKMFFTEELFDAHYPHIKAKDCYEDMKAYFMENGPVIAIAVIGTDDSKCIAQEIRNITGPTFNAPKGTIRGDFMPENAPMHANVLHATDPKDDINLTEEDKNQGFTTMAQKEIYRFFVEAKKVFKLPCKILKVPAFEAETTKKELVIQK